MVGTQHPSYPIVFIGNNLLHASLENVFSGLQDDNDILAESFKMGYINWHGGKMALVIAQRVYEFAHMNR